MIRSACLAAGAVPLLALAILASTPTQADTAPRGSASAGPEGEPGRAVPATEMARRVADPDRDASHPRQLVAEPPSASVAASATAELTGHLDHADSPDLATPKSIELVATDPTGRTTRMETAIDALSRFRVELPGGSLVHSLAVIGGFRRPDAQARVLDRISLDLRLQPGSSHYIELPLPRVAPTELCVLHDERPVTDARVSTSHDDLQLGRSDNAGRLRVDPRGLEGLLEAQAEGVVTVAACTARSADQPATILVADARRIRIVIRGDAGEPHPAAQLTVTPTWDLDAIPGAQPAIHHLPSSQSMVVHGVCGFDLAAGLPYRLVVTARGFAPLEQTIESRDDVQIELALVRREPLGGRVLDPGGSGIGGATIHDLASGQTWCTDPTGRFRLDQDGPLEVRVAATGYAARRLRLGPATAAIRLESAHAIDGRVWRAGRPVAGAEITVFPVDPTSGFHATAVEAAVSRADGRFEVAGLPAGRFTLRATLGEATTMCADVPAGSHDTLLEFDSAAHRDLRGQVTDRTTGRPLRRFTLVRVRDLGGLLEEQCREVCDPGGRFEVPGAWLDGTELWIRSHDHVPQDLLRAGSASDLPWLAVALVPRSTQ